MLERKISELEEELKVRLYGHCNYFNFNSLVHYALN